MMKSLYFIFFAILAVNARSTHHLLGAKECTWGPSYWCSNLTAAAGCNAVKHCIQTVWEHKTYPEDTDTVCQTCLTMVKQARDQLESNETQEEIKEVFEGSCKLIPLKIVNQECCKLADNFIPELVDTLASQMNPQVVCSVAGLCNNAKIDKLLEDKLDEVVTPKTDVQMDTCGGCHKVVDIMESKFHQMSRDDFLQSLLHICGRFGTFTDACSNIIVTYFTDIYNHMSQNFNSQNVCLMSGECSTNFHVHKVEITPLSNTGVVPVKSDDLPCDLCKQLVGHLRDLLIADTTELEFQKVLQGLCKQSGSFKDQCLSIVNEYYPVIYKFLVDELNSTAVCTEIQICPNSGLKSEYINAPIIPLLPVQSLDFSRVEIPKVSNVKIVAKPQLFEEQTQELMQLPIERMNSPHLNNVYNKQTCAFCEYFLHYLQVAITAPKTEKNIKDAIDKACNVLPSSINETCVDFVNTYGDAFVAILAQEIDPSTVCPLLQLCPGEHKQDIEVFMQGNTDDKPNCPLCLFAVTRLEEMVKEDRTKTNIKHCLSTLCSHLSGNLAEECNDFVSSYTDELVEMLADDFKPQEVCVYLKVCTDKQPAPQTLDFSLGGQIYTNEIPDFTANGKIVKPLNGGKPECVLCEFVMEKLETMLKDRQTEDEIKTAIHGICNHMPKSISKECNDFVSQYADLVFDLLIASVKPNEICQEIQLCDKPKLVVPENVGSPQCSICKIVMRQIEQMLPVNVSEGDIKTAVKTVCSILPQSEENSCDDFIDKNGKMIYNLLVEATSPGEVCSLLFLCGDQQASVTAVKMQINKCSVCETTVLAMDKILQNPLVDHAIEHVLEKSCRALPVKDQQSCKKLIEEYGQTIFNLVEHMADTHMVCKEIGMCSNNTFRPKREVLLGASKCTWGPSYWCEKEQQARDCGDGAYTHCTTKVWKGAAPQ